MKTAAAGEEDASSDLGTGSIDFAPILKAAKDNGMLYYIVEQERYEGSTPLKSIEADAAYMKKLAF
jgi:sugar phosphate isomerase/epimerase